MSIMTLTPAAIAHIQAKLQQKKGANIFRLSIKQTGCSGYMYVPQLLSAAKVGDIKLDNVTEFDFYLAADAVDFVRDTELDFVTKSLGMKQLQFNNPNVEGVCGCGESFKLKEEGGE